MNFSVPPSADDFEVIAAELQELMPEELMEFCDGIAITIEEFIDDVTATDIDVDDPYEVLALYKSGKEISPGLERKSANDDDVLVLYRRAILDVWCEGGEDLSALIRQIMIEELGRHFDFSDDEIDEMNERHYQGML